MQQGNRQSQLENIIPIPAHPAQDSFPHQLIFKQTQHQPSHQQPAHHDDGPTDIPADYAVGNGSFPKQDGCSNQHSR